MKIKEALNSLEKSWSRENVLLKIKKGENSEKIINDFFNTKKQEIKVLTSFINEENKFLLNEVESLSNIESKLINKIKNYSFNKINLSENYEVKGKRIESEQNSSFNLGLFMMRWSNKFVFVFLLVISAIALSKQAWA